MKDQDLTEDMKIAIKALTRLTDKERLKVFAEFCKHCGCIQPTHVPGEYYQRCQCWNDA